MRKFRKLTGVVLIMVTLLGLCSGCIKGKEMVTIKFGVPWEEGSEAYEKVKLAVEDSNMFTEDDYVQIEMVTIPSDEEGKKAFLKDVASDKIAFFFYERDDLVTPYIESGKLASLATIQGKYPSCFEDRKDFILDTATDVDGVNHMLVLMGNYQGIFFNEQLFIDNGVKIPKTWDQFTAAIEVFKEKGITPIAGGFADEGFQYMLDELILMEGGVAEHSYVPKYGVVNSWKRAITDFKELYENGTFNSDCMTATYADAQALFDSGKAAMIVGSSKDIADESADTDNMGVFSFPVSSTGKKNIGDIICDFDTGVYINSQFLKKRAEIIDTMVEFVLEYLDAPMDDSGYEPEAIEWSYDAYKTSWTLPANPYTIGVEEKIEDNENVSPEDAEVKDPSVEEDILAEQSLIHRVFNMMENTTEAGRSLATEFKTFEYFTGKVRDYILNGGDIEQLLVDSTNTEIAAQNEDTGAQE